MSEIKSNSDDLVLNSDGGTSTIKFQTNGVERGSISTTGAFTATTIDATALTGALPVIDGSALTGVAPTKATIDALGIAASSITGALPAIDGSNLSGISSGATPSASNPTSTTNGSLGSQWVNTTTNELFVCIDDTTNKNKWRCVDLPSDSIGGDYRIDFLVIGGGGGSVYQTYAGEAAGAGGYRCSMPNEYSGGLSKAESPILATTGTLYTITIGAGGPARSTNSSYTGASQNGKGVSSSINNIISEGGGAGTGFPDDINAGMTSGGSSGGNGGNPTQGIYGQGFSGAKEAGGGLVLGGGGGAGGIGVRAIRTAAESMGGYGGQGLGSKITGSWVCRAGGGGGGIWSYGSPASPAFGGAGGGGTGGCNQTFIQVTGGSTNTGGGAGGSGHNPGASGGSGVSILRMLTSNYTSTITGSPTVTTDGSYTILTFTGSGSYTG